MEYKVGLKAEARLIYQLGEQLIPNEIVALSELIKNSYDADGTIVKIFVNTICDTPYGKGKILVIDNGHGMTKEVIEKSFMKISTSNKVIEKFSKNFSRRMLGSKGLGRLSTQRLGNFMQVSTISGSSLSKIHPKNNVTDRYECILSINWNEFMSSKNLSDIYCNLEVKETNCKCGTEIAIYGLKNIDYWKLNSTKKRALQNEILQMTSIFNSQKASKFRVDMVIDEYKFSNELIDENILDVTSDVKAEFSFKDWKIKLNISRNKKYIELRKNKLLKRMKEEAFKIKTEDNDLNRILSKYEKTNIEIDLLDKTYIHDNYSHLSNITFYDEQDINQKNELAYPGMFDGTIYAADMSEVNSEILIDKEYHNIFRKNIDIRNVWKTANGIYIFRDYFRLLPYGKDEWMGFTKLSQNYKNNIYKAHTISGYINLDSRSSENIKEQTNRMGIVQDEYGLNLLKIIKEIISPILVREDVELRKAFSIPVSELKINTKTIKSNNGIIFKRDMTKFKFEDKIIAKESLNNIYEKNKEDTFIIKEKLNNYMEIEESISTSLIQENKILKDKLEEFKKAYPLIAQGMVAQTLSHEFDRIYKKIIVNTNNSIKELKSKQIDIREINKNLYSVLDGAEFLYTSIEHLKPLSTKKIDINNNIELSNLLKKTYNKSIFENKLSKFEIKILIDIEQMNVKGNEGLIVAIFDNLVINSIYWLERYDGDNKEIVIKQIDDKKVVIYDTGFGISRKYENKLFEAFESGKEEEGGRGLGLYICRNLMEMLGGSINLSSDRNTDDRLYKFILTFKT